MTILARLAALEAANAAAASSLDAIQKRLGAIEDDTAELTALKVTVDKLGAQLTALGAAIGSDDPAAPPAAANDAGTLELGPADMVGAAPASVVQPDHA